MWEQNREGTSSAWFTINRNGAPDFFKIAPGDGEPKSGAFVVSAQAFADLTKFFKNLFLIFFSDPDTGILNPDGSTFRGPSASQENLTGVRVQNSIF